MKKVLIILVLACSCGVKKKNVERQKKEYKEYVSRTYDIDSNTRITANATTNKVRITPIDKEKPAKYTDPDGREYVLNNAELITQTEHKEHKEEKAKASTITGKKTVTQQENARKTDTKILRMNTVLMIFLGIGFLLAIYFISKKKL